MLVSEPDSTPADRAEQVRQWLLRELLETYRYPREWLGRRILRLDPGDARGVLPGLLGVVVTLDGETPYLACSIASDFTAAQDALRRAMRGSETLGQGLATDGHRTVFLRRRFATQGCDVIGDLEVFDRGREAATCPRDPSREVDGRLEDLFYELHSLVRDIDGLHADEALDELCKLLHARLYEERLSAEGNGRQGEPYGSVEARAAAVRRHYREASGGAAPSHGAFDAPLRLSGPAVVRVMEALQGVRLRDSDADVKGRAFQRLITPAIRAGMGQYFTPEPVVQLMVDVTEPRPGERILDPFCGSAHFLSRCLARVGGERCEVHGIEKSERMVRIALTGLRLQGGVVPRIRCGDSLLDFANYPELEPASFDLILTNPPFGSLLGAESLAQLGELELARGRSRVGLEVLGLERCLQLLRPGGRLGIVVPDSLLSNRSLAHVRDWVAKRARVRAVVSLPLQTFTPFGANIKTSVLFLQRRLSGQGGGNDPVHLVRVDAVGYDATGRAHGTSELAVCAEALRDRLAREGW